MKKFKETRATFEACPSNILKVELLSGAQRAGMCDDQERILQVN